MNILTLHTHILKKFDEQEVDNNERLELIDSLLAHELDPDIAKRLQDKKALIKKTYTKSLFIAKTGLLIQEYLELLKNPVTVKTRSPTLTKKAAITQKYGAIVRDVIGLKRWANISILDEPQNNHLCQVCDNDNDDDFITDENTRKICLKCSAEQFVFDTGITHRDYNRVNVVGKFVYNRVLHFQDCIKQYQGKQNCKVPDKVYQDLETKFNAYRILIDSPISTVKYSKLTKQHIIMFLKELKHVKQYENVNLIYYTLTGKRENISHLEQLLIEDFRELVKLYDSIHGKDKQEELDRKNFMNVQYLLFQLLKRHGHPCKFEDFSTLKTIDRKLFHDNICRNLFAKLEWNFTPTF